MHKKKGKIPFFLHVFACILHVCSEKLFKNLDLNIK